MNDHQRKRKTINDKILSGINLRVANKPHGKTVNHRRCLNGVSKVSKSKLKKRPDITFLVFLLI